MKTKLKTRLKTKLKIRSKMIAVIILAGIILTGCGNDALLEQIRAEKADFVSSVYEVVPDKGSVSKTETEVNEERLPFVKKVVDLLNEKGKRLQTKYAKSRPDMESYYGQYYEEDDLLDWTNAKAVRAGLDGLTSYPISWFFSEFSGSGYGYMSKEDMSEVLGDLADLGIRDMRPVLEVMDRDMKINKLQSYFDTAVSVVSQGFRFVLMGQYQSETDKGKPMYSLDVEVSAMMICPTKTYVDFLKNTCKDGFYIGGVNEGGFMERINLLSSWDDPETPYNKCIDIYFRDNEPVQLELTMEESRMYQKKEKGVAVFTDYEKETIKAVLSEVTGDERGAGEFADNFSIGGKSSGEIGSWKWSLKREGLSYYKLTLNKKER